MKKLSIIIAVLAVAATASANTTWLDNIERLFEGRRNITEESFINTMNSDPFTCEKYALGVICVNEKTKTALFGEFGGVAMTSTGIISQLLCQEMRRATFSKYGKPSPKENGEPGIAIWETETVQILFASKGTIFEDACMFKLRDLVYDPIPDNPDEIDDEDHT
jgi:hypothetical protein